MSQGFSQSDQSFSVSLLRQPHSINDDPGENPILPRTINNQTNQFMTTDDDRIPVGRTPFSRARSSKLLPNFWRSSKSWARFTTKQRFKTDKKLNAACSLMQLCGDVCAHHVTVTDADVLKIAPTAQSMEPVPEGLAVFEQQEFANPRDSKEP